MELKPGDCVALNDSITNEQHREVTQAFIDAGAQPHSVAFERCRIDKYVGWSVEDDKVWSLPYTESDFTGRQLTVDEVLGNA